MKRATANMNVPVYLWQDFETFGCMSKVTDLGQTMALVHFLEKPSTLVFNLFTLTLALNKPYPVATSSPVLVFVCCVGLPWVIWTVVG